MFLSIDSVTQSTITVTISGMDTGSPANHKMIAFRYRESSESSWTFADLIGGDSATGYVCADGTYTYTYRNLNQATEYDLSAEVDQMTSGGSFVLEGTLTDTVMTSGSSPSSDPSYDFTYTNNSVTVTVSNSGNNYLRYYCETNSGTPVYDSDDYGRSTNTTQVITGLQANTTYWISVQYSATSYGSLTYINNAYGNRWSSFTTGGGGGGGGSTQGWWIYTGSAWIKVTPYIFNGLSWIQVSPCIYDGGWIVGT